MSKVPVFLVDDHPLAREGIRRLIELDDRIQVVGEAGTGEEALARVVTTSAKVVLMDVMLPGINGIETTRQLITQNPQLRVIIISAFGDRHLSQGIEAGACGYILKTANQQELVSAVIRAAGGDSPIDPKLTHMLLDRQGIQMVMPVGRGISSRQREILRQIAEGVPSQEIADRMAVSDSTLTRELRQIFDYLGVDDRAHAVAEALRRNLL